MVRRKSQKHFTKRLRTAILVGRMHILTPPDSHHLRSAIGWLELGNPAEAAAELKNISVDQQENPAVLDILWRILARQKDWAAALDAARKHVDCDPDDPTGWINRSYVLHEIKRTQEAWDCLLPAATRFSNEPIILYNLACYACQLGQLSVAHEMLKRSARLASSENIKQMALSDPDLQSLRSFIEAL
jgi:predicted Zn-dependent protease